MSLGSGWMRVPAGLVVGAALGAAFGAVFGWMASWFAMGPDPWQGVRETAPWFAAVFAIGGFLIGLEGDALVAVRRRVD
ncbi:MAG: hypothetical protein VKO64_08245 [Candidatus Sericytochromatia bacterium]|nr:hypothetical protein [Candidatus Sericytochromatia bacterium]